MTTEESTYTATYPTWKRSADHPLLVMGVVQVSYLVEWDVPTAGNRASDDLGELPLFHRRPRLRQICIKTHGDAAKKVTSCRGHRDAVGVET